MQQSPQSKAENFLSRAMSAFQTPSPAKKALHVATPVTEALTPATPFSSSPQRELSDEGYYGEHEEYRIKRLFHEELHRQEELHRTDSFKARQTSTRKERRHLVRRKASRSRSMKDSYDNTITPATSSSTDASDDSSPARFSRKKRTSLLAEYKKKNRVSNQNALVFLLGVVILFSVGMLFWSDRTMDEEFLEQYERTIRHHQRHHKGPLTAGLRGKLVQMAGRGHTSELRLYSSPGAVRKTKKLESTTDTKRKFTEIPTDGVVYESQRSPRQPLEFSRPPALVDADDAAFDDQDFFMYRLKKKKKSKKYSTQRRVVYFGKSQSDVSHRPVRVYASDFTDNTQYYGLYDSDDERLSRMEIRQPIDSGECVHMQDWQTTHHPSCNAMHELGMDQMGETATGDNFALFGTKGYWRNAWRVDSLGVLLEERETIVLKTLKFQHMFEEDYFEHNRVDAVAMERLTSSPNVVNIFGFCGHSVMTEFADGSRVGELADKSKKTPLARLRIARDIADGLADVHGIDGDGNTTFVHLDINPANVVSIGGTLKLNDFNIGILRRWNTTSNTQCGFPAQYPNPQWRSPEEARNEQDLTEKVDVFSMGHIFFRLICGHEPWNKLEHDGKPSKEEISVKVQKGVLPRIPDEIMSTTDKEVAAIRDAMLACYTFDPNKRPSARKIASHLEHTLETLQY